MVFRSRTNGHCAKRKVKYTKRRKYTKKFLDYIVFFDFFTLRFAQ